MVSASSSSNVDGRWVARGHTGSKRIDGEAGAVRPRLKHHLGLGCLAQLTVALGDLYLLVEKR